MADTKFTPGPWEQVSRDGKVGVDVRAASGRTVAATYGVCNQANTAKGRAVQAEEDRANARLIAAAPEMFEALKAMLEEKEDYMRRNHLGNPSHETTNKMARAALAKAVSNG